MEQKRCVWLVAVVGLLLTVTVGLFVVNGCGGNGNKKKNSGGVSAADLETKAKKETDPFFKASLYVKAGRAYLKAQDKSTARRMFNEASKAADGIHKKQAAFDRADAYATVADAWAEYSNEDECEKAYEEAQDMIENLDRVNEKCSILVRLARVKVKNDEKDDAVKDLKTVETLMAEVSALDERVRIMSNVVKAFVEMENKDEAIRVLTTAMEFATSQPKAGDKSELLAIVGRAQVDTLKDSVGGLATLDEALKTAKTVEDVNLRANRMYEIAVHYMALKKRKTGCSILSDAKELVRNLSEGTDVLEKIETLQKKSCSS
jgi:tetratricopeptide (TPR) repeat protein